VGESGQKFEWDDYDAVVEPEKAPQLQAIALVPRQELKPTFAVSLVI
jgi:hypothetical protein